MNPFRNYISILNISTIKYTKNMVNSMFETSLPTMDLSNIIIIEISQSLGGIFDRLELAIAKNYLGGLLLGMELLKKGAKEIARSLCTMQISFKKSIKE